MTASALVIFVMFAAATVVWHRQISVARLRRKLRAEIAEVRAQTRKEVEALRAEMREELTLLSAELALESQRLTRIESAQGLACLGKQRPTPRERSEKHAVGRPHTHLPARSAEVSCRRGHRS